MDDTHDEPHTAPDGRPRVVAGVDGSAPSMDAVAWAAGAARRSGAVLRLVTAWLPPTPAAPVFTDDRSAYRQRAIDRLRAAAAVASEAAPGIEIETHAVQRPPAQALLDASRDAALLVVGRRGLGGLRGLLLGSVSQQCAEHASCPVVIIPE
jgi:nucleotide-binding universal stress UspA family protein